MTNFALGRKPRAFHPNIPHMSALISGRASKLAPIPKSADWLSALPSNLGVMLNDNLGDCTLRRPRSRRSGLEWKRAEGATSSPSPTVPSWTTPYEEATAATTRRTRRPTRAASSRTS